MIDLVSFDGQKDVYMLKMSVCVWGGGGGGGGGGGFEIGPNKIWIKW